jgi:translation elongation factor P/translation initiation factor 5A
MQISALDLRKNYLVAHQGGVWKVNDWSIMRNDRRQYVYVTLKNLQTGRITELKENGDNKFEVFEKEEIDLSHSFTDGIEEVFYDPEGVEYRCPAEAVKDALFWPAEHYVGFLVDGKLLSISPPAHVIVRVTETAPPLRGGGSSGLKDALLENGVKVRVTQLVEVGDRVRIDPVTLEFKENVGP